MASINEMDEKNSPESPEREMSFFEHIDELRQHIIRSVIAIVIAAVGVFAATNFVFEKILFAPVRQDFATYKGLCWLSEKLGLGNAMCYDVSNIELKTLQMGEAFGLHLKVCFFGGLIIAFPYIVWELWRFISPGLYDREKKAIRGMVGIASFLFLLGILFGYYILAPFGINFLINYDLPMINDKTTEVLASSFINYMLMFTLPVGLLFELPILIYYLAMMGIVTPKFLKEYRRHAIIVILIVAAVVTPPDVVSQTFIAIPIYILYEISIGIAAKQEKLRIQREKEFFEN